MLKITTAAMILASGGAMACPSIDPAPRTITAPAADYASSGNFSLDAEEILVYDYGKNYGNVGKYRNPFFISDYAHALYRDYLKTDCKDEDFRRRFLIQSDHLISAGQVVNGALVWTYPFPIPAFDLQPGWISGIAQSRIGGVLQRAYALTGEDRYHRAAEEAMQVYYLPMKEGGVLTESAGVSWYEEGASPLVPSFKVLNGHITAVAGILDFYKITGEEKWKRAYELGVAAVKRDLPEFDTGYLSYYSLASPRIRRIAARQSYNSLHVSQLLWLYDTTADPDFLKWASHFEYYEENRDRYSASFSTNAKTNGPERAAGFYGSAYWSSNRFPAELSVETGPDLFKGVAVQGTDVKAMPRDFKVDAMIDGEWQTVASVEDNELLQRRIDFTYNVKASGFRLKIASDNGNRNVAVSAFMPIRTDFKLAPVTNDCNYVVTGARNNLRGLFDETTVPMRVYCPGWLILPLSGQTHLDVVSTGQPDARFAVSYSEDLATWKEAGAIPANGRTDLEKAKFIRLSFDKEISSVDRVALE